MHILCMRRDGDGGVMVGWLWGSVCMCVRTMCVAYLPFRPIPTMVCAMEAYMLACIHAVWNWYGSVTRTHIPFMCACPRVAAPLRAPARSSTIRDSPVVRDTVWWMMEPSCDHILCGDTIVRAYRTLAKHMMHTCIRACTEYSAYTTVVHTVHIVRKVACRAYMEDV
jgi:hypothetical protein